MSEALLQALRGSQATSAFLQERAHRVVSMRPPGGGANIALQAMAQGGFYGNTATPSPQVTLQHAQEQYRHFSGWTGACAKIIGQRIARQPIRIARVVKRAPGKSLYHDSLYYKRPNKKHVPFPFKTFHQDLDVLDSHPVLNWLNRPNQLFTRWTLLYVTVISLELTGASYWWIYDAPKSDPFAGRKVIWPVPTNWLEPKHDKGLYSSYMLHTGGTEEPVEIPGQQIVRFAYPDPSNVLGITSTLQMAARSVVADENISESQRRLFANGIFPGLAIIAGRNPDLKSSGQGSRPLLTREQRAQILYAIKQAYRGMQHFDEPIVLDALIEDVKRISTTGREMDYLNSGKYTKERVTQQFGVNPVCMGQLEGVNRASSVVADDNFVANCLGPKIEQMSGVLTYVFLPLMTGEDPTDGNPSMLMYIEDPVPADPDELRSDRGQLITAGGLSINELRLENGLPPIWGGDVCLVQSALLPIHNVREDEPEPKDDATWPGGQKVQSKAPPGGPPGAGGPPGQQPGAPPGKPGKPKPGQPPTPPDAEKDEEDDEEEETAKPPKSKAWQGLDCLGAQMSKQARLALWVKAQEGAQHTLQEALGDAILAWAGNLVTRLNDAHQPHGVLLAMAEELQADTLTHLLRGAASPHLTQAVLEGATQEYTLYRPQKAALTDFALPSTVTGGIRQHLTQLLQAPFWADMGQRWRQDVVRTVRDGISQGLSNKEVAARLQDVLGPGASKARCLCIARTESTAALNAGGQVARRQLARDGLVKGKTWLTVDDDRTRDAHADLDDVTVGVDEPFDVGGEEAQYPGDIALSVEMRANCRCTCTSAYVSPSDLDKSRVRFLTRCLHLGKPGETLMWWNELSCRVPPGQALLDAPPDLQLLHNAAVAVSEGLMACWKSWWETLAAHTQAQEEAGALLRWCGQRVLTTCGQREKADGFEQALASLAGAVLDNSLASPFLRTAAAETYLRLRGRKGAPGAVAVNVALGQRHGQGLAREWQDALAARLAWRGGDYAQALSAAITLTKEQARVPAGQSGGGQFAPAGGGGGEGGGKPAAGKPEGAKPEGTKPNAGGVEGIAKPPVALTVRLHIDGKDAPPMAIPVSMPVHIPSPPDPKASPAQQHQEKLQEQAVQHLVEQHAEHAAHSIEHEAHETVENLQKAAASVAAKVGHAIPIVHQVLQASHWVNDQASKLILGVNKTYGHVAGTAIHLSAVVLSLPLHNALHHVVGETMAHVAEHMAEHLPEGLGHPASSGAELLATVPVSHIALHALSLLPALALVNAVGKAKKKLTGKADDPDPCAGTGGLPMARVVQAAHELLTDLVTQYLQHLHDTQADFAAAFKGGDSKNFFLTNS
jgi:phage portal protein BeeE